MRLDLAAPGEWRAVREDGSEAGVVLVRGDESMARAEVSFLYGERCTSREEHEVLGRMWVYLVRCGFTVVVPDASLVGDLHSAGKAVG